MHSVPQALQVSDEAGRNAGDEASLRHDAGLDVVELQTSVVTSHLAWRGGEGGGDGLKRKTKRKTKKKSTV